MNLYRQGKSAYIHVGTEQPVLSEKTGIEVEEPVEPSAKKQKTEESRGSNDRTPRASSRGW